MEMYEAIEIICEYMYAKNEAARLRRSCRNMLYRAKRIGKDVARLSYEYEVANNNVKAITLKYREDIKKIRKVFWTDMEGDSSFGYYGFQIGNKGGKTSVYIHREDFKINADKREMRLAIEAMLLP